MEADDAFDPGAAPPPDTDVEPEGFVVVLEPNDRIHFLDWGGPTEPGGRTERDPGPGGPTERDPGPGAPPEPGVLLVHGLGQTAWSWIAVARRLRRARRTVAMDLRGHGLSDAPTSGYEPETLADDVLAVAEGSGLMATPDDRIVLAGHGFGAIVAAWAAALLGDRCAGLVLVDGGWTDLAAATGQESDEFARTLDEPPEILRSMTAFLADRRAFDPGTWDADQERAARTTVVETHAGRVVPTTRPHVLARSVEAMFAFRPTVVLPSIEASIAALTAADDEDGTSDRALEAAQAALEAAGRRPIRLARFPTDGHNLLRYRPREVAAAVLALRSAP